MLVIDTASTEYYDRVSETFVEIPGVRLRLEHSLIAMSKWESKWLKPFIGRKEPTAEELYSYIECMVINEDVINPFTIRTLSRTQLNQIADYINSPMTATTINNSKNKSSREVVTSELIYYWMISFNVPFECERWHLNRLLTLINVCGAKNETPKKQSPKEIMARNRELNAARRKAMQSSG